MDAKTFILSGCFLLSIASPALSEEMPQETSGAIAAATTQTVSVTTEQPDPYKDVTWDKVTKKNQSQDQTVTVYTPRSTGQADFVSVTSTGTGTPANVVVGAPPTRRSKKWFLW